MPSLNDILTVLDNAVDDCNMNKSTHYYLKREISDLFAQEEAGKQEEEAPKDERERYVRPIHFRTMSAARKFINDIKDILEDEGVVYVSDIDSLCNFYPLAGDTRYGWKKFNRLYIRENLFDYSVALPIARLLEE